MENSVKKLLFFVCFGFLLCVESSIAMKRLRPGDVEQKPVAVSAEPLATSNPIWVKCSDGQLFGLPQWKIDQIKVLQVLFMHQKGGNREANPINASMCTSDELKMLSNALDVASQASFSDFFTSLSADQSQLLINAAGKLEANGIFALCVSEKFPQEIQNSLIGDLRTYIVAKIADLPAYKQYVLSSPDNFRFVFGRFVNEGKFIIGYTRTYGIGDDLVKHVWDSSSKKYIEQKAVNPQEKEIVSVKFKPSFSSDRTKKVMLEGSRPNLRFVVLDMIAKKELCSFPVGHTPGTDLEHMCLSPDGNYLAAFVSEDQYSLSKIVIWDLKNCSEFRKLDATNPVAFTFSPDGSKFVFYDRQQFLVYDFPSFEVRLSLNKPSTLGSFVHFNDAGNQLLTNFGNDMQLWDIDYDVAKKIELFKEEIQGLDASQVKVLYSLLLARLNNTQPVFHKTNIEYKAYASLPNSVKEFLASPLIKNVIAQPEIKEQSEDEIFYEKRDMLSALIQAMTTPEAKPCKQEHNGPVNAVATAQSVFLSGGLDNGSLGKACYNNLFLWNPVYQDVIKQYCSDQWVISAIAFSDDGNYFVVGGQGAEGKHLTLWDRRTDEKKLLEGLEDDVRCVAFSPDGSKIVAGCSGDQNNLFVWDVKTGNVIHNLQGHVDSVNAVAFGQDGKVIASGSNGNYNNLLLWNAQTGDFITSLKGHNDSVKSLAFSPDGWKIVSGSAGAINNLCLWNSDTFIHNVLVGHKASVNVVLFSKDGRKIISAGNGTSNNLYVWNAAGRLLFNLQGHSGSIKSAALNHWHDKNLLVSGGDGVQDNLFVWDINFGKKLYNLANDQQVINSVAFSADDTRIISGGGSGGGKNSLIVWDLNTSIVQALNSLNKAQIGLLYSFYVQSRNNMVVDIADNAEQLAVYTTLSQEIKDAVCKVFKVRGVACDQLEVSQALKKRKTK